MRVERIFDLVVWLFIAAVGLVAAYVCFGILSSQASGRFQQYSLGGAIAGALVSWGVLTSVYLQLRGSSIELQELRNRTEELQNKLIRGAPRPQGFDTEVDERQRIVLARPKSWQPKGGTIFDLELSAEEIKPDDTFAAAFRCYFVPIEPGSTPTREQYYENQLKMLRESSEYVSSYSHEIVRLGGESAGVESLKVIARQFVRTHVKAPPETGRVERTWNVVSRDDFVGRITYMEPAEVRVGRPAKVNLGGHGFRKGATCYVNGEKRETEVAESWQARVSLVAEDVAYPRVLELVWQNPDTGELRSKPWPLMVTQPLNAEQPGEPAAEGAGDTQERTTQDSATEKSAPAEEPPGGERERVVFQEVARMRVVCYHEALEKIYYLEFWDDLKDFTDSSGVFNRVLASVRFLD